jgi:hypothetical protein
MGSGSQRRKRRSWFMGVKAVANEIVVKLPASAERDDTDIAEAAVRALQWRSGVPADDITAKGLGGRAWAELDSELEGGSTFKIALPARRQADADGSPANPERAGGLLKP